MKKLTKTLFLTAMLLISINVMAQESEPVILQVVYNFEHVYDLNKPNEPLIDSMRLKVAQNGTKYYRSPKQKPLKPSQIAQMSSGGGGGGAMRTAVGMPVAVVQGAGINTTQMFQHPKDGKLNLVATLGMSDYLIEMQLPKINWKISTETREIGGYKCQKAVGAYAGRTYTAWFAPELPFQNGPWKLSGLPGLILEAVDAKGEVKFLFKEFDKDIAEETTVASARKLITVKENAYLRAKEAYDLNPVAAYQAQIPNGPEVRLAYQDLSGKFYSGDKAKEKIEEDKKAAKERKENPLELK